MEDETREEERKIENGGRMINRDGKNMEEETEQEMGLK